MTDETEVKTLLVIADVYKLSRDGKKFDKDLKRAKIKFNKHSIDRAYCDEMNARWQTTGTWCVIDEDASLDNADLIKKKADERLKRDDARETAGKALAAMALGVNSNSKDEPEEVGSMKHSIKELKALESLTGMSDAELNEFFETENRAGAKAYLGELIVANNE